LQSGKFAEAQPCVELGRQKEAIIERRAIAQV
jgi:hypothetical protein